MPARDYGPRLLRAYAEAFPAARVSVVTTSGPAAVRWEPAAAVAAARVNLSTPVLDRALGRDGPAAAAAALCVPHIVCDASQAGTLELSPQLREAVGGGAKLSPLDKAELAQLADVPLRIGLGVAYAANRCLRKDYVRACVPLFLQADGEGHANLLILELAAEALHVYLFEPNGLEAMRAYGTVATLFAGFEDTVGAYLLEPRAVELRPVGAGLQTALGEVSTLRRGMARITRERGYPVCEAVVLWFMRQYMTEQASVSAFEAGLLDDRAAARASLLAFVEDLAAWVRRDYAEAARLRLERIFAGSDVLTVDVRYGKIRVRVRP